MTNPPSPTTLRPPAGRASGVNRRAIVIGGIVILVVGGFAASQMYLVDEDRLKTKEPGMQVNLNNDDFLKNAPDDYSWMHNPEMDQPAAAPGALPVNVAAPYIPPPPAPDPPIDACRRPSMSYSAGALESAYDGTLEYRSCRQWVAYEVAMREYVRKYPPQSDQNGSPIAGGGRGQLVSASAAPAAGSTVPGARRMSVSASAKGASRPPSTAPAQTPEPAPMEGAAVVQAASLYHEGSLEELPIDECVVPAGFDIPATLAKDVKVSQAGSARIVVSRDVLDYTGTQTAIPVGTQIVVNYTGDLKYGQERAQIGSTVMTLPNGLTMSLDGLSGYDPTGQTGLPIDVNNHNWALFGTAILGGLIDAIPAMAGMSTNVEIGGGLNDVTSTGRRIVERELNRPPSAEPLPAGTEILITLDKHLVLGECYE